MWIVERVLEVDTVLLYFYRLGGCQQFRALFVTAILFTAVTSACIYWAALYTHVMYMQTLQNFLYFDNEEAARVLFKV